MRALRLIAKGDAEPELILDEHAPLPSFKVGEALIRVSLAGICSTDLELVKGYYGFRGTIGHEFVGVVEQSSSDEWTGRRVVSSINFADSQSREFAQFGREHHPQRQVLGIVDWDGAMADYVVAPLENLFEVPPAVADRQAVFTEPLAAALRIAQQLAINPDANIAVIGPGRLGMLIGKVLSLGGARLTMIGRNSQSLELARLWGLECGQAVSFDDSSFDVTVEATGSPQGLSSAIRLTRPLGTLVLKSTYAGACSTNLTKVVVDEIKIVGSRCGPFGPALRLLESGAIPVQDMIDGDYPITEALKAMKHAAESGVRKILIDCS